MHEDACWAWVAMYERTKYVSWTQAQENANESLLDEDEGLDETHALGAMWVQERERHSPPVTLFE